MTLPSVSFVVPHKGRENLLAETLASIAALDYEAPMQIIVATQNDELTSETISAAGDVSLEVVYAAPTLTIAALRNLGAGKATGDLLAFLDADIELAPDWLHTLAELLIDNPELALVSAVQICADDAVPLEKIRTALSNATVDGSVAFLPGRNLLLRRETFDAVGGFPEHLTTCEDFYFTDKVAELGKLWYSSNTYYVHLGEDRRLDEMYRKEVWRGQSNLQSLRGRRVAPGEWPSLIMPLWISVALLAAAVLLLSGQPNTGLLALLAGAAPFAAYVSRLYFLADRTIALKHVVAFYGCYFPARAWGSLLGVFRSVGNDLHDR